MLQIISGRFFDDHGKINHRDADAILYSNYLWMDPIKTSVADLRPADHSQTTIAAYVVRYQRRYQPAPDDVLVLPGGSEAVEQFRLLASLWFEAFFHKDQRYVELLCRPCVRHDTAEASPRAFVPRFFDAPKHGRTEEAQAFVPFLTEALGMPRKQYNVFIGCLRVFFNALEALNTNFDLAYSMLVYVLEALSKTHDTYQPSWADYDPKVRQKLDRTFGKIDESIAEEVRGAILEGAQLKLTKRFIDFVSGHVEDRFFTEEAQSISRVLTQSDLLQALRTLYKTRSEFVHELKLAHEMLRHPMTGASADVFVWENEPFLTMSGLVRLTHHVLRTFAKRQPSSVKEDYPTWRAELPGLLRVYPAPRYWIWNADAVKAGCERRHFSDFISHVVEELAKPQPTLVDMRNVMKKIQTLVEQVSLSDRVALCATYFVFNSLAEESAKQPDWQSFFARYESVAERCSVEFIAAFIILGIPIRWPATDCADKFLEYAKNKYKSSAVSLPGCLETAISSQIANLFLDEGRIQEFAFWTRKALLDAGGHPDVQSHLKECSSKNAHIDIRKVLGLPEATTSGEEATSEEVKHIRRDTQE